jgi:hypothetical protein
MWLSQLVRWLASMRSTALPTPNSKAGYGNGEDWSADGGLSTGRSRQADV